MPLLAWSIIGVGLVIDLFNLGLGLRGMTRRGPSPFMAFPLLFYAAGTWLLGDNAPVPRLLLFLIGVGIHASATFFIVYILAKLLGIPEVAQTLPLNPGEVAVKLSAEELRNRILGIVAILSDASRHELLWSELDDAGNTYAMDVLTEWMNFDVFLTAPELFGVTPWTTDAQQERLADFSETAAECWGELKSGRPPDSASALTDPLWTKLKEQGRIVLDAFGTSFQEALAADPVRRPVREA